MKWEMKGGLPIGKMGDEVLGWPSQPMKWEMKGGLPPVKWEIKNLESANIRRKKKEKKKKENKD